MQFVLFNTPIIQHSHHREVSGIDKDAVRKLMDYAWPGNVRELKNAIEHAFVTVNGSSITVFDLPPELRDPNVRTHKGVLAPSKIGEDGMLEKDNILEILRLSEGHRGRAAKALRMSPVTLWKKINHYGIQV